MTWNLTHPPATPNDRSGVAFILVLSILLGLLVLAAPFITVALNDNAISESAIAEAQAEAGARSIAEFAAHALERTTEARERARGGDPDQDIFATPEWDTEPEVTLNLDLTDKAGRPLLGQQNQPLLYRRNVRGEIWDLKVRDEQTWPHLWTAPPFLIAASLGRTVTTGDLTDADAVISVESATGFPAENGAIWIDGERITYSKRDGTTFTGCSRGVLGGGKARKHKAETFVLDDRSREIAMVPFRSPRANGGWREPLHATAAKEVTLFGEGVLTPVDVDRLGREFTTRSWKITADPFGPGQTLAGPIDPTADTTDGFKIRVRGNDGINAGTVVRISDGVNTEYGFVVNSQRGGPGSIATITLAEPTKNPYAEGIAGVAPLIRHPVNVNTASRDTLRRVLEGVQITGGRRDAGKTFRVTSPAAELFADGLISARPIKNVEQLRDTIVAIQQGNELVIDAGQMAAVFRNAVDAGDWSLGQSTVPFSFSSHDYYRIETAAVVNDKSGRERARREITELTRVAASGPIVMRLDTQAQFEEQIFRARQARYTTTFPKPVERVDQQSPNQIPASRIPRMLVFAGQTDRKGVFGSETEGDVRLWPARAAGFSGYMEHFDGQAYQTPDNIDVAKIDPEGWLLANGPHILRLRDGGQAGGGGGGGGDRMFGGRGQGGRRRGGGRGRGQNPGAFLSQAGANPIRVDMWVRPEGSAAGRMVFYDLVGADPDQRITLSRENDGTIRVKMRDRTIDNPNDNFEEACETVFTPPPGLWKADTWYNVGCSYRSCKPEDLAIWWDGFKRGEARFSSVLASNMSKTDMSFSVERAEDWPVSGACWIGREVVEFQRAGSSFTVIQYPGTSGVTGRGRRGTYPIDHAAGEFVQLFGYSTLADTVDNKGGIAIPRGGAKLATDLGSFNVAQFQGNDTQVLNNSGPGGGPGGPGGIAFEVLDPGRPNGDQLQLTALGGNADLSGFQTGGGYIIILSVPPVGVPTGVTLPAAHAELAYYSSRSGNTLLGIQPVPNPVNPALAQAAALGNIAFTTTRTKHYIRIAGGAATSPRFSAVFPISVILTGAKGYLTPQAAQGGSQYNTRAEFLSLGTPDYSNISSHKVEWIRYHHVDESKSAFLCDEVPLLSSTVELIRAVLLAQAAQGGGTQIPNASGPGIAVNVLQMRGQEGTDIFGYTTPGSSSLHTTNEDVTPVFHVVQHPGIGFIPPTQPNGQPVPVPGAPAPGWGDSVTIESPGGAIRKRSDVTWSKNGRVSLGESLNNDFTQQRLPGEGVVQDRTDYLRLLKFPSGELPLIAAGAKGRAGGDVEGSATMNGHVDEVRVAPFQADRFIVWDQGAMGLSSTGTGGSTATVVSGIDETTDEIPICNCEWLGSQPQAPPPTPPFVVLPDGRQVYFDQELSGLPNNDAGLIQVDDEIIAYRQIGTSKKGGPALLQCQRGFMGTTAQKHGFGTNCVFLDFVPVTMLNNALQGSSRQLDVASTANFPTNGGLLLVDNELMHFTEILGPNTLRMPPILDEKGEEKGGVFRGRFGTTASAHDNQAIVVEIPFRYWDRYAESQDNPELSYFGFAVNAPGAYFDSFGYEERRPSNNVQIVALVRTEPDVPWTTDMSRMPPGLMRFEEGMPNKQPHAIHKHGSSLEARFYFRFLGNSFDPVNLTQHEWKTSPELLSTEVRYYDETQVLMRETKR